MKSGGAPSGTLGAIRVVGGAKLTSTSKAFAEAARRCALLELQDTIEGATPQVGNTKTDIFSFASACADANALMSTSASARAASVVDPSRISLSSKIDDFSPVRSQPMRFVYLMKP